MTRQMMPGSSWTAWLVRHTLGLGLSPSWPCVPCRFPPADVFDASAQHTRRGWMSLLARLAVPSGREQRARSRGEVQGHQRSLRGTRLTSSTQTDARCHQGLDEAHSRVSSVKPQDSMRFIPSFIQSNQLLSGDFRSSVGSVRSTCPGILRVGFRYCQMTRSGRCTIGSGRLE